MPSETKIKLNFYVLANDEKKRCMEMIRSAAWIRSEALHGKEAIHGNDAIERYLLDFK